MRVTPQQEFIGVEIPKYDAPLTLVPVHPAYPDHLQPRAIARTPRPDVCALATSLARDARIDTLRFRPLAKRAALHLPCTQVNVVGEIASIRALLARIPGLTMLAVPEQPRCCGAAGNYFIEHPAIADRLRDEKLAQIDAETPDIVLTTNIGCRIHLANGLRGRADAPPMLHPLALLAQQLDNSAQ